MPSVHDLERAPPRRVPLTALSIAAAALTLATVLLRQKAGRPVVQRSLREGHPPGCAELSRLPARGGAHRRMLAKAGIPLSDPLFSKLCSSEPVSSARGGCYHIRGRIICLPSFLVVGFTKAGTSVFFQYASQHKRVRVSSVKEPAYLGSDLEVAWADEVVAAGRSGGGNASGALETRRRKGLRWYASLFPACPSCERGEATPGYAWRDYSSVAAAQAAKLLGGAVRLIMLVREPIARAASHYIYFARKRRLLARGTNLSTALRLGLDEFQRCAAQLDGWTEQCVYRPGRRQVEIAAAAIGQRRPELWRLRSGKTAHELLQAGLYSEHYETWQRRFGKEAILVIDLATLIHEPVHAMRKFEKHLGLPYGKYEVSDEHALSNDDRGGGPKPGAAADAALAREVPSGLRADLQAFFRPFNRKLRRLTGVGWEYSM